MTCPSHTKKSALTQHATQVYRLRAQASMPLKPPSSLQTLTGCRGAIQQQVCAPLLQEQALTWRAQEEDRATCLPSERA